MRRILHLNYSQSGGAGKVAHLLSKRQNEEIDYKSEFIFKITENLRSSPLTDVKSTVLAGVDNFIVKDKNFIPLFSLLRDKNDKKILQLARKHTGILHLHWINGILTPSSLLESGFSAKSIIWTMHDMAPITGGCHYSLECNKFQANCDACPAVRKTFRSMVKNNKSKKNVLFAKNKKLSIVVPSNWFAKKIKKTMGLDSTKVSIIPNPVEDKFFQIKNKKYLRDKLKLPSNAFIVGFVSQNIDNPIKNFSLLLQILENTAIPVNKSLVVLAIGESRKKYFSQNFKIIVTGAIIESEKLVDYYAVVDLMISLSSAETFGLSISEACAQSVPSIVMKGTATEEIIVNDVSGYIASNKSELALFINLILKDDNLQRRLGSSAKLIANERFRIDRIYKLYEKIYDKQQDL